MRHDGGHAVRGVLARFVEASERGRDECVSEQAKCVYGEERQP